MSGNLAANSAESAVPLSPPFRFSPGSHKADSINWHHWEPAAFQEAQRLDRPIFLLITSSWCHWCHLMDETTLSEPSIIAILNRDYVPIRVDSDLRPDINSRYNQNGWPSVVLLSAEGEILWGGVYVPARQMLYYLGHIRRYYSEHRSEITEQVRTLQDTRFTQKLAQTISGVHSCSLLQEERAALTDVPSEAGRVLLDLYDEEYGGFRLHPHLKFPHPEALELFLDLSRSEAAEALLELVQYSLEQMLDGGLWDKEDGGFFRYSAASDWSMPHTEKLLDEIAAMLHLLLRTVQVTSTSSASTSAHWRKIAFQQISYINTTLWQPRIGAFGGSQSADEEYYEPGLYFRASRQAPLVDTTIYTSWNARMIAAYLLGASVLQTPALETLALRALDWLCKHMLSQDGTLYHAFLQGQAYLPNQLADHVWLACALLDAYEQTSKQKYLEITIAHMHRVYQELFDEQTCLFYDYPAEPQAEGRLALREQPLIENALAAECFLRMAAHSKRSSFRRIGIQVLSGCLDTYRRAGIAGVMYACVVEKAVENRWLG